MTSRLVRGADRRAHHDQPRGSPAAPGSAGPADSKPRHRQASRAGCTRDRDHDLGGPPAPL